MTTKKNTDETINYHYDSFTNYFIPFGSMDIRTAVTTALEVGESGEWAAKQVEEFCEDTGTPLKDCDPVYCVYDTILQEARNEITELTNFDFCNDGADIYTYGNFMATSYDWSDNAPEKLKEVLKNNKIKLADLNEKTQWFLDSIGIELK